jgi:hypothetical protein
MAGFGSATSRANRRYRATVSRSIPSSRAIRRWDQPPRLNVLIVCCISILSWFIAAQSHETDPDCNDYLTSKWLGLIRPLVAGFHSPLTLDAACLGKPSGVTRAKRAIPVLSFASARFRVGNGTGSEGSFGNWLRLAGKRVTKPIPKSKNPE